MPTISAAEQTKSSWARPIKSHAAVPSLYRAFFEPFQGEGHPFPYTVLAPSNERFIHKASEMLICDLGHEICVLEKSGMSFELHFNR